MKKSIIFFLKRLYLLFKKILSYIIFYQNFVQNNKDYSLKLRYFYIQNYSRYLIDLLDLKSEFEIDIADNISYKIAGYNVNLDWYLKNVIMNPIKFLFLIYSLSNIPQIRKLLYKYFEPKKRGYEIKIVNSNDGYSKINKKYENIYFASMNNYLNSIIPHISSSNNAVLILPKESKEWLNFQKVKRNKINHLFLEDIINYNNKDFIRLHKVLRRKFESRKSDFLNYKYNLKFKEPLIKEFLINFIPKHLTIIKGLEKFMKDYSLKTSNFYIARDRRSLENAFIQIANTINNNTQMLIHGMLSLDMEKALWQGGRYKNVKNVIVWGEHDKDAIIQRQQLLGQPIPDIIINVNPFLKKINQIKGNNVLILCERFTNRYIYFFSKEIKIKNKIIVRLHPIDKEKIAFYKRYERDKFIIDDLRADLKEHLSNAIVVISFSSTAILEAIINKIPTLIIDFKDLNKNVKSVFNENPLNRKRFEKMLLSKGNFQKKITDVLYNENFRREIILVNKELLDYFVSVED